MSALPPKADIGTQPCDVGFVPKADIMQRSKKGIVIQSIHRRGRATAAGRLGSALLRSLG